MKKMSKFRIPRKIKKKIKKDMWLYPMDEVNKTYLYAKPYDNQIDYDAFKRGDLNGILLEIRKNYKNG
jgi:hypothetical protein